MTGGPPPEGVAADDGGLASLISRFNAAVVALTALERDAAALGDFATASELRDQAEDTDRIDRGLKVKSRKRAELEVAKDAAKAASKLTNDFSVARALLLEIDEIDNWAMGASAAAGGPHPKTILAALSHSLSIVVVDADGTVREPVSGIFNVYVAPGENVQAAVDACPPSGCVLLLPGTYDGPLVLTADKVVHVFGRGLATLRGAAGAVLTSEAGNATLDGLLLRYGAGGASIYNVRRCCVWIKGGRLRLQACDVTSTAPFAPCVFIEGGADPVLTACKCVRAVALSFMASRLRVCEKGEGQCPPAGWGSFMGLSTGLSNWLLLALHFLASRLRG